MNNKTKLDKLARELKRAEHEFDKACAAVTNAQLKKDRCHRIMVEAQTRWIRAYTKSQEQESM